MIRRRLGTSASSGQLPQRALHAGLLQTRPGWAMQKKGGGTTKSMGHSQSAAVLPPKKTTAVVGIRQKDQPISLFDINVFLTHRASEILDPATIVSLVHLLKGFRETADGRRLEDLRPILGLLQRDETGRHEIVVHHVLCILRTLSRKESIRIRSGAAMLDCLTMVLGNHWVGMDIYDLSGQIIVNLCFERANALHMVDRGGLLPLVGFFQQQEEYVFPSIVGALQSICFFKQGRMAFVALSGSVSLTVRMLCVPLLESKLLRRIVGLIHNLSAHPQVIEAVRVQHGIPVLVSLLNHTNIKMAAAAAGCIQNISREDKSQHVLLKYDTVRRLAELLLSNSVECQAAVAGALLNLLGSNSRLNFPQMLTDGIVLGVLQSVLGEEDASDDEEEEETQKKEEEKELFAEELEE